MLIKIRTSYTKEYLDSLVHGNYDDRMKAVRLKYGLNKLINDEEYCVRLEVARQGYGLDKLVNDEDRYVRETAIKKLKEMNN